LQPFNGVRRFALLDKPAVAVARVTIGGNAVMH